MTSMEKKIEILSEVYRRLGSDSEWAQFVAYNDLGLPLAFVLESEVVENSPSAQATIDETWASLMNALGDSFVDDEDGEEVRTSDEQEFESLDQVFEFFDTRSPVTTDW